MAEPDSKLADVVRFRPSRVEGVADVDEVLITHDAIVLFTAGQMLTLPLTTAGRGREIASGRIPVGELHFSASSYRDSHFVFYTTPRITIFMPADGPTAYPQSHFWRIQKLLSQGGFKLYEDGPPTVKPILLDPHPLCTIAIVVGILAFCWLYVTPPFLSATARDTWRHAMLTTPRKPKLLLGFGLPDLLVPAMIAFRHARGKRALLGIIVLAYGIVMVSEWSLRQWIADWALLDGPPYNLPFWAPRQLVFQFVVVLISALIGWSWRSGCLEPIQNRK